LTNRNRYRMVGERVLQSIPVVFIATLLIFGLLQLIPGDPAIAMAGENPSPARINEIRELLGLNKGLLEQYFVWLGNVIRGDFSRSILTGESVGALLARAFPNTLLLVAVSTLISIIIGIPLGVLAATRVHTVWDGIARAISGFGVAVPNFWIAMVMVSIFAMQIPIFPVAGVRPFMTDPLGSIWHMMLPAIGLAFAGVSNVLAQTRSALLEVLGSQYIRTLRAKGLKRRLILWQHALKNVGVNLVTVIGLLINRTLGATVIVESIFAIPGVGSLISQSALSKDFPVVQAIVLVLVLAVVAVNLIVDVLSTLIDPRVQQ
jgi:peptide/nickel transport system permease protein